VLSGTSAILMWTNTTGNVNSLHKISISFRGNKRGNNFWGLKRLY